MTTKIHDGPVTYTLKPHKRRLNFRLPWYAVLSASWAGFLLGMTTYLNPTYAVVAVLFVTTAFAAVSFVVFLADK